MRKDSLQVARGQLRGIGRRLAIKGPQSPLLRPCVLCFMAFTVAAVTDGARGGVRRRGAAERRMVTARSCRHSLRGPGLGRRNRKTHRVAMLDSSP